MLRLVVNRQIISLLVVVKRANYFVNDPKTILPGEYFITLNHFLLVAPVKPWFINFF